MPTNLPPEYFEVERRYRQATSNQERIALIEEMLSVIPKHKGTDKLRGDLRRKLAKLKSAAQSKKGPGRRDSTFYIEREGAGQVALVGPTNTGKSSLLAALTNAEPLIAEAPFTTWTPTPGMMPMENIQIQLIDTPPLDREYVEPELIELIKRTDVVVPVVDLQTAPVEQLLQTADILGQYRIFPLHRRGRYEGERRPTFKPFVVLVNKYDGPDAADLWEIVTALLREEGQAEGWTLLPVSARSGHNLERIGPLLFEHLGVIRVYAKPPGQEPDHSRPFVLEKGSTVLEFAREVHQEIAENLRLARVWGSAAYDGLTVGRDHILHDGDVVELHA